MQKIYIYFLYFYCLTGFNFYQTLYAADLKEIEIKQQLTEILLQEEFATKETRYIWQLKNGIQVEPNNFDILNINFLSTFSLANVLEWLLWISISLALLYLIWQIYYFIDLSKIKIVHTAPFQQTFIFNTLTEETFNLDELSTRANNLWEAGKKRAALSLLYRGTLSYLQTYNALKISDSATENDCLTLIKQQNKPDLINYFSTLSCAWQKMAYADQPIDNKDFEKLVYDWNIYFPLLKK